MILRVYAAWGRSRTILGILLFFYVPQIIVAFVFTGIFNNPGTYFSGTSQSFIANSLTLNRLNFSSFSSDHWPGSRFRILQLREQDDD